MICFFSADSFKKIHLQISFATVVPPIMVFLAKHPMVDDYDLSSLTDLVSAAAPLSEQLENEVKARLNNDKLKFRQGKT